eukprot:scaffold57047_cov21-Phaeocystis_antarctica.AAC.1
MMLAPARHPSPAQTLTQALTQTRTQALTQALAQTLAPSRARATPSTADRSLATFPRAAAHSRTVG